LHCWTAAKKQRKPTELLELLGRRRELIGGRKRLA
jgi:hypothetical protein